MTDFSIDNRMIKTVGPTEPIEELAPASNDNMQKTKTGEVEKFETTDENTLVVLEEEWEEEISDKTPVEVDNKEEVEEKNEYTFDIFKDLINKNSNTSLSTKELEEIFKGIDTDGNGTLSKDEIGAIKSGAESLEDITEQELNDFLNSLDKITEEAETAVPSAGTAETPKPETPAPEETKQEPAETKVPAESTDSKEKTVENNKTSAPAQTSEEDSSYAPQATVQPSYSAPVSYSNSDSYTPSYNKQAAQTSNKGKEEVLRTLEDVEKAIAQKTEEKNTNQQAVDQATTAITQAQDEKIQKIDAAQKEYEEAQQAYETALENDEQVSEELKTRQKENSQKITENEKQQVEKEKASTTKDKEITEKDKEIYDYENEISTLTATIDALTSKIKEIDGAITSLTEALNAVSDGETPEEKEAANSKRSSIQGKIDEANTQKQAVEDEKKTAEEKKKTAEDNKTKAEDTKTTLEKEKKDIDDELKELKETFEELDKERNEIEKEIEETCSDETKELLHKAQEKRANVQTVTASANEAIEAAKGKQETAKATLDKTVEDLNGLEAKRVELQYEVNNSVYNFDFAESLTDGQKADLDKFEALFKSNKEKYEAVAKATGVPAELIAAIHWRESSGNFNTYLHNGEPLGKVTTLVPAGKYFEDWTEAAIDAISTHNPGKVKQGELDTYYDFAECYNGTGYRNKGVASPYVWSGTEKYTRGKYVADGVYDPNVKDSQLGVAVMLKRIMS